MRAGYLIADVEASTARWERDPSAMRAAMALRGELIEAAVLRHGGWIHDRVGDNVLAIFHHGDALACALDIQLAMQAGNFDEVGGLTLRIGVHAGPLECDGAPNPVFANRVSRIAACGWGGQIVVSGDARETFTLPAGSRFEDLGVVRLRGVFSPVHLYGLVHDGLKRVQFPPPRAGGLQVAPVPPVMGPLFGRERELGEIHAAFIGKGVRHITIVGAGGNGKTRLALEAARVLGDDQAVVFVVLNAELNNEGLDSILARALDLPAYIGMSREQQVIEFLRDKEALIVLDNAEALAPATGLTDRILDACPRISVLAAARAPMHCAHEMLYALTGLTCETDGGGGVRGSGAYQFFAHEVSRIGDDPLFDDASDDAFSAICKKVSGSPLALHLTARWRRVLSLGEILARLEDGLDFLSEAVLPYERAAGLRAVFAASWALLTPEAQRLLARLSVFRGDFGGAGAESVSDCPLSLLADLEVRGLVERVGAQRFSLHPLVKDYARERLEADPLDARFCRLRHCKYFLERVVERDERSSGAIFSSEYADLGAAWTFAVSQNETGIAWRAADALFYGLASRSKFQEAADLLSACAGDTALDLHCRAMRASALMHIGLLGEARQLADLVLARECEPLASAHAHQALGNVDHAEGNYASARAHYDLAREARSAAADTLGLVYSYLSLAVLGTVRSDVRCVRDNLQLAYQAYIDADARELAPVLHLTAADLALLEGRTDDAHASINEALACDQFAPQQVCRAFIRLAEVLSRREQYEGARGRLRDAIEVAKTSGDMRGRLVALIELARICIKTSEFAEAKAMLLHACRESLKFGAAPLLHATLTALTEAERAVGNASQAQRLCDVLEAGAPERERVHVMKRAIEEVMLAEEYRRLRL